MGFWLHDYDTTSPPPVYQLGRLGPNLSVVSWIDVAAHPYYAVGCILSFTPPLLLVSVAFIVHTRDVEKFLVDHCRYLSP